MLACCHSGALGEWADAPATGLPAQQGTTRPPSTRLAIGHDLIAWGRAGVLKVPASAVPGV